MTDQRPTFLGRLVAGRRRRIVVLALWLLLTLALGPLAGRFEGVQKNEPSSFLPGDAESVAVLEASEGFPSGEVTPAIVIFRDPAGLDAEARTTVERKRKAIAEAGIEGVGPRRRSRCRTTAPAR